MAGEERKTVFIFPFFERGNPNLLSLRVTALWTLSQCKERSVSVMALLRYFKVVVFFHTFSWQHIVFMACVTAFRCKMANARHVLKVRYRPDKHACIWAVLGRRVRTGFFWAPFVSVWLQWNYFPDVSSVNARGFPNVVLAGPVMISMCLFSLSNFTFLTCQIQHK